MMSWFLSSGVVGRYCEYQNKDSDRSNEFDTFDDYKSTLELVCQEGSPGSFTWTPDEYTPDVLYYQVSTNHRHTCALCHAVELWCVGPWKRVGLGMSVQQRPLSLTSQESTCMNTEQNSISVCLS